MKEEVARKKVSRHKQGFTLVELLVAVSLFLVIMTISLGAVISVLNAGRKSRAIKDVMTNLNFALEVMAREIKFGKNYGCSIALCSNGDSQISLTSSAGASIIYRLNNNKIEKSTNGGSTYLAVTAPEITVQNLKFYILGYQVSDGAQPRVLIMIRGYGGNKPSAQSSFILQTTVSQRELDS
ncbi:prepilin-type N-terminal cleavage/methylation domain-containing protein [Patescibacteria group bacterium]|nr:MAG: prepilin-type N-terminal cleavage/methylation domain-containing protein [Patescibacteria group bacterium]